MTADAAPDRTTQDAPLPPHAREVDAVINELATRAAGLSSVEALERQARHGPNTLREQPGVPVWRLLLDEVLNPLVLILIGAVGVLTVVSIVEPAESSWGDVILIVAIVVLNGALGFVQNYRAQRGIESLRRLEVPEVRVLRDGSPTVLPATALVPGDVVLLEEGDRVPADGRLIRAHDLRVDESSLTGESVPVDKSCDPVPAETPLADRTDMVYLGTAAVAGRARAVLTATGMRTQVGTIAEAVQAVREGPTPFQREVGTLGRRITAIIAVLIGVIAVLQLTVGGLGLLETFVAAVALAVAAIPEGLPVVMTLALAFGTRRMLERQALVRSLPVVEIVGGAQVVCTDKTGTITEGRMSLRRLQTDGARIDVADTATRPFTVDGRPVEMATHPAILAAGLCNNAHRRDDGSFLGDPTEVALLQGALLAGADLDAWDRLEEQPFSSERKRMSVVVQGQDRYTRVLVKGAPEVILPRCTGTLRDEEMKPMTADDRAAIDAAQAQLTGEAFRVLALAGRDGVPADRASAESDLVFYGLAALADPPRAAAGPALRATAAAGIRVVMITGDNPRTAGAIGKEIGLAGRAIEGRELDTLSDAAIVEEGGIFARVEPIHKLRILDAFRSRDQVVVMTGDGVNDAPALKGADVGIAMGVRGTDVARDASDMVLLDDNFATIVAAIEEGRRISANIRKFLNYLLSGNVAEVLVILVASLFGLLPVTAVQILWVNLVTDSGPAVALAVDPAAPGLMDQPPRRGPIIGRAMLALVVSVGVLISAIVLATFAIGLALFDLDTARTMTFTALVTQEYLRLVVIRLHEHAPLFANRWLVLAVVGSLALQLALLYSPLGTLFGAVALGPAGWAVIAGGVVIGLPSALGVTRLVRARFGPL
jgi:Ca2+-transporting ATPase